MLGDDLMNPTPFFSQPTEIEENIKKKKVYNTEKNQRKKSELNKKKTIT